MTGQSDSRSSVRPPLPLSALRCCQCGREGYNGFAVIPQATHEPTGTVVGPFIVCASAKACRRRWPKNEPMVD